MVGVERSNRTGGVDGAGDSEARKTLAVDSVGQGSAIPLLRALGEGEERQRGVQGEEAQRGASEIGVPGLVSGEENGRRTEQGNEEFCLDGQWEEGRKEGVSGVQESRGAVEA